MEHIVYCSSETTELAKAMLKVQAELQPALKDRENTFSHSRYATLNSVMDACRDALINNGIWLTQYPVPVEAGHVGLATKLTHAESGQWQSSLMVMPLPKTDPQGYGSAITYSRRYALSALIGIVTEEDDDGVSAGAASNQRSRRKRPAQTSQDLPAGDLPFSGNLAEPSPDPQVHPALAVMPRLDGISYSLTTTQDGKTCIIATGNTNSKKQLLSQAGFKFSEQRQVWWRYADAA